MRRTGWVEAVVTAATLLAGAGALDAQTMDDHIYWYASFDELEYVPGAEEEPLEYDVESWIGGDVHRVWIKAHGEQSTREPDGHLEAQALYGRTISAFWNAQVGLRLDRRYGGDDEGTRGLLAAGVEGLAPYWFHVESHLFVSQDADLSARLEASWDMLLTQRLVLEPEVEVNLALQEVPEWGVGSGLNDVEFGARLRYEFLRELAPYVGWSWTRSFGETADLARAEGHDPNRSEVVFGLHWWY